MIASRRLNPITPLMTLGKVAALLGQPLHRVAYIVRSRNIREAARAGRLRVFDMQAMEQIRRELQAIDAKQERRHG